MSPFFIVYLFINQYVSLSFLIGVSIAAMKHHYQKPSWRENGLLDLSFHITFITEESQN